MYTKRIYTIQDLLSFDPCESGFAPYEHLDREKPYSLRGILTSDVFRKHRDACWAFFGCIHLDKTPNDVKAEVDKIVYKTLMELVERDHVLSPLHDPLSRLYRGCLLHPEEHRLDEDEVTMQVRRALTAAVYYDPRRTPNTYNLLNLILRLCWHTRQGRFGILMEDDTFSNHIRQRMILADLV